MGVVTLTNLRLKLFEGWCWRWMRGNVCNNYEQFYKWSLMAFNGNDDILFAFFLFIGQSTSQKCCMRQSKNDTKAECCHAVIRQHSPFQIHIWRWRMGFIPMDLATMCDCHQQTFQHKEAHGHMSHDEVWSSSMWGATRFAQSSQALVVVVWTPAPRLRQYVIVMRGRFTT